MIQFLVHWEDIFDRFAGWFKLATLYERRHNMNITEIPAFVKDVVQLCNDLKSAESTLTPQFPQLVADAQKLKADGEKLLGVTPS